MRRRPSLGKTCLNHRNLISTLAHHVTTGLLAATAVVATLAAATPSVAAAATLAAQPRPSLYLVAQEQEPNESAAPPTTHAELEALVNAHRASTAALTTYRVARGDTLSGIAHQRLHGVATWRDLWYVNAKHVKDPNLIFVGQVLALPHHHMAKPAGLATPHATHHAVHHVTAHRHATHHHATHHATVHVGASGFEACVIRRESGGNPDIWNPTGHWGLYQFDLSTWESGGGSAAAFGHVGPAEQHRVFENVYAARGTSPWAPYDGC